MNRNLCVAAFAVGLAAVGWVAAGYVGTHVLALAMTLLIAAFYLMGGLELMRFQRASTHLRDALPALPDRLPDMPGWLERLDPSLQHAVRLRIEGERVALPGPSMTPYLVGLLVLLGMLGTFLGMVVTLKGAVLALESTTDLATIRAALAAPVKGLGLAFGTSVAGVAASAMLGLVSALCRRDRLQTAQQLDARIAATLPTHTPAHLRRETLAALQSQAGLMPELVGHVQALMAQMERQSAGLSEQLLAGQDRFHRAAQADYTALAASVGRALERSAADSARAAGAAIQPMVEATVAGITRETAVFQQRLADSVQQQLDGLSARFDQAVGTVTEVWSASLARHQQSNDALTHGLGQSLAGFTDAFEQRTTRLLTGVDAQHVAWQADLQQALAQSVRSFEHQSAALLQTVERAHVALRADAAAGDAQRLAAWTQSLSAMAETLTHEWKQAGARTLAQQEQICHTLEQTARDLNQQAEAHAQRTLADIARLIDAASEAPRAAGDMMAVLRRTLSDSSARDKELLDERARIMGTLGELLEAVNHGVNEQRAAIDGLIASSSASLQRVVTQFNGHIESDSARLIAASAQVSGSAIEMASLGDAFHAGVQLFSQSNEALMQQLTRIEAAMGKSTARSDEQLAYYVAQARELIDLSISSQQHIVEDLQQLAIRQTPLAREPA